MNSAQVTRFVGQIMDGGATRNRRAIPPMEKPIYEYTNVKIRRPFALETTHQLRGHDNHPLITKIIYLVIVYSLDCNDISLFKKYQRADG